MGEGNNNNPLKKNNNKDMTKKTVKVDEEKRDCYRSPEKVKKLLHFFYPLLQKLQFL